MVDATQQTPAPAPATPPATPAPAPAPAALPQSATQGGLPYYESAMGALNKGFAPKIAAATQNIQNVQKQGEAALQPSETGMQQTQAQISNAKMPKRDMDEISGFSAMLMVMGALAGRHTMAPATAALNNLTGIMEGIHQGNTEKYNYMKEQFDANYKLLNDRYKRFNDEYNRVLQKNHYDMAAAQTELETLYREYGMDATQVANISNMMNKNADRIAKFQTEKMKVDRLTSLYSPQDTMSREAVGAMVASGVPLSQAVPGWGQSAVVQRTQARNDAIQQIMKETGFDAEEAGVELARREVAYTAGKSSVAQLTKMRGATVAAVDQLEKNLPNAENAMKAMGSSDLSPVFNAIINQQNRWTGKPEYASLFYFINAIAMESARLQSGGQASIAQLHAGAAEEAKQWANMNMTPQALLGLGKSIIMEGNQRIESYDRAISEQGLHPEAVGGGEKVPPGDQIIKFDAQGNPM